MTHGLSSQHKIPIRFAFLRLQGDGELARRTGGNMVEDRIGMIQALSLTSAWVWVPTHMGSQNTGVPSLLKIVLF